MSAIGVSRAYIKNHLLLVSSSALVLCLVISWTFYILFGDRLVETLYRSQSRWIADKLMEQRAVVPLKAYLQEADSWMVVNSYRVLTGYIILACLIRKPTAVLFATWSLYCSFSMIFLVLEVFPSLIRFAHFDIVDYYAYKVNYIADNKLVYREKPFIDANLSRFRGANYAYKYNIEVAPISIDWQTDEDGFRNGHARKSTDIVIVGDSYIEYGDSQDTTFGKMLEKNLPGFSVASLGKGGYGPIQYLEVLKRYGIDKNPKYAILAFYEGNDIADIKAYLKWEKGDREAFYGKVYTALTGNLLQRYLMALTSTIRSVRQMVYLSTDILTSKIWQFRGYTYPDIAVLDVGDKNYKVLFVDKILHIPRDELLKSDEIRQLRLILTEFRTICEEYHIVPIVLYIPAAAHIYAEYSTPQSGSSWLQLRQEQIDSKNNLEDAVISVSQELGLEHVSLTTAFERGAEKGKMLYYAVGPQCNTEARGGADYALDSHWNAQGRKLASVVVADILRRKFIPSSGVR